MRVGVREAYAAEWMKLWSLRSTVWALVAAVTLGPAFGVLVSASLRAAYMHAPPDRPFDPLFPAFYGLTFAQLPLVVLAVLAVTGEYSSGTIRVSLLATPRRGAFYSAKLLATAAVVAACAVVTVLATYGAAQSVLGPFRRGLASPGVTEAIAGACLYLLLICVFAAGVAAIVRSSVGSLALLLPLLFLGSQGLGNIPKVKTVTQFLPDQAGMVVMHLTGPAGDPQFGRPYGPWAGMMILLLWTIASVVCGYVVLHRKDA